MININEYNYLWDSEKDDWVLVSTSFGYGIVNKKNQSVLAVSDEALESALIERMLSAGNKKYSDINNDGSIKGNWQVTFSMSNNK